MNVRYLFMDPGEEIALVRLGKASSSRTPVPKVVITMRKNDFRDLVYTQDTKAALLDFDGTFTRIGTQQRAGGKEETYYTGWQELRKRLPVQGHRDLDRHYALYKRGDISPLEWLYVSIACYQQYGLTLHDVVSTAGSVPFREGSREFISFLKASCRESYIISFGMKEWISCRQEFAEFPHEIVASEFICNAEGKICGVKAGVTEETKGLAAKQLLERSGLDARHAIAVGNSWHDRHLFSAANISVYLSHGGYKGSGIDHATEIERLKGFATAIVFDDTLYGVTDLLRKVIAKTF